ncbi:MAG: site-specific DNA-methyltransferase [Candidatus Micrarchaeota archaeon]|nr:site-specific DNA-methyltransferase [Candidatus Micrarchaeota archaeon]
MYMMIKDSGGRRLYKIAKIKNSIILGDAIKVLPKLPSGSVDLIFTDPPYFMQLPSKKLRRWGGTDVLGVKDGWDKFGSFEDYDKFTIEYLTQLRRVMKPNATIWVIGTYHNIHRIGKIMLDMGFWILNDVIWLKSNPMPNFLGVRFTNGTETLLWAVKDKQVKKYTFNKSVARSYDPSGLGMNVWRIPLCSGDERIRDRSGNKVHSTQKPEELLRRILLTSTKEGDIVLDPMAGVGTTGAIAKRLKRNFIMIEKEKGYVREIEKRLKGA